jgi:hypothetical protein
VQDHPRIRGRLPQLFGRYLTEWAVACPAVTDSVKPAEERINTALGDGSKSCHNLLDAVPDDGLVVVLHMVKGELRFLG